MKEKYMKYGQGEKVKKGGNEKKNQQHTQPELSAKLKEEW